MIAQKFGAKAAEIAQYASFITLGSWLKNSYPAPGLKIINSFYLDEQKFAIGGETETNMKTALVICEKTSEEKVKENFKRLNNNFNIKEFRDKDDVRTSDWEYYINAWGKYVGEVVKTMPGKKPGVSRTGTPFTKAIRIQILNHDPSLIIKLDNWLKTFEVNYKEDIKKYSGPEDILEVTTFKKFLKDYLYPPKTLT